MIGIELDDVVAHFAFSGQIEVGVICQVDRRRFVGCSGVVDANGVIVSKRVSDGCVDGAGEAFFAVRTGVTELDRLTGGVFDFLG